MSAVAWVFLGPFLGAAAIGLVPGFLWRRDAGVRGTSALRVVGLLMLAVIVGLLVVGHRLWGSWAIIQVVAAALVIPPGALVGGGIGAGLSAIWDRARR